MAKRFTDSEKWKKVFIQDLPAAYKLFWLYLLDDCNHVGVWEAAEIKVACIRLGETVSIDGALSYFGDRIQVFDSGKKWFIPDFIGFQYGELNPSNRLHSSVLATLQKHGLRVTTPLGKGVDTPYQTPQGAKDKDKDMEMDKAKDNAELDNKVEGCLNAYPSKRADGATTAKSSKDREKVRKILIEGKYPLLEVIKAYVPQCNGYPKNFATFLNQLPLPSEILPKITVKLPKARCPECNKEHESYSKPTTCRTCDLKCCEWCIGDHERQEHSP